MTEWWQWEVLHYNDKKNGALAGWGIIRSHCCYLLLLILSFCPIRYQFTSSKPTLFPSNTKSPMVMNMRWGTVCPSGQSLVVVPPGRHLRSQKHCIYFHVLSDLQLSSWWGDDQDQQLNRGTHTQGLRRLASASPNNVSEVSHPGGSHFVTFPFCAWWCMCWILTPSRNNKAFLWRKKPHQRRKEPLGRTKIRRGKAAIIKIQFNTVGFQF